MRLIVRYECSWEREKKTAKATLKNENCLGQFKDLIEFKNVLIYYYLLSECKKKKHRKANLHMVDEV